MSRQSPYNITLSVNRLEAFSDGVFAIVITLLILDIRIPEVDYDHLGEALRNLVPRLGSYLMSFVVVGLYWIGHHHLVSFLKRVNGKIMWLGLFGLLAVSFIPFPTSLMGKYPLTTIPLVMYGINLIMLNATGYLMLLYMLKRPDLAKEAYTKDQFRMQSYVYLGVNLLYGAGIALAFFSPVTSLSLYAAILFYAGVRYMAVLR